MSDLDRPWPGLVAGRPAALGGRRRWPPAPSMDDLRMATSTDLEDWRGADDAALVEACLAGRSEPFDVLVERHQRAVYRLCYRFAGSHEEASDLTQDVFLRAYRSLATFRRQASFKTWIHRIAVNAGLNWVAARPRAVASLDEAPPVADAADSAAVVFERARRAEEVRRAVTRLPPRQRAAIVLRVFQELTHEEAAQVLGCTVGTVKANVFHALRKLRTLLERR